MKGNASYDNKVQKTIELVVHFLLHVLDVMGVFKGDQDFRMEMSHLSLKFVMNFLNRVISEFLISL